MNREREIDRFTAVEDGGGEVFTIIVIQEYIEHQPLAGPARELPTVRRLELPDGSFVNDRGDGTYKIVLTGQIVRKLG